MIKQSYIDSDSILYKKFKILRMSILLGNSRDREKTLEEFEETAREIDKYKKELYEEVLSSKMYTTTTLEEEKKRLEELISFIENRIDERNKFIDDYLKVTNNFLDDIDRVSEEDNLSEYKLRLDNINEYLNNVKEIKNLNKELEDKRKELEEKYEDKANNEVINNKLEEELIDEFNKIIIDDEYYKNLNYLDIDNELNTLNNEVNEKKDVMDTFISSFEALKNTGISGAEREEYLSYVQDAKNDYYKSLEKKYTLELYKLVLDKENDYDKLFAKREEIEKILVSREEKRKELNITDRDEISYFKDICCEQFSIIKSQKFNMENIDQLIVEITNKEERLEELEEDNNRDEIVSLLEEYSVSKPVIEKVDMPEEKKIHDEVVKQNYEFDDKPANMIIRIDEPVKMNIKNVTDTAKLVMKKVVIVLEPKRFNSKKDKLLKAELELEEEKRIKEEEENKLKLEQEKEDRKEPKKDSVGIEFSRHDVFTDDDADEIGINTSMPEEIKVPTEIVIEEPKEETLDLFKETDPFLDDNDLEINDHNESLKELNIPKISNIGTVKPNNSSQNNMFNKIEEASKENDDIILPTMGIVDNKEKDVPIVSENYIN